MHTMCGCVGDEVMYVAVAISKRAVCLRYVYDQIDIDANCIIVIYIITNKSAS